MECQQSNGNNGYESYFSYAIKWIAEKKIEGHCPRIVADRSFFGIRVQTVWNGVPKKIDNNPSVGREYFFGNKEKKWWSSYYKSDYTDVDKFATESRFVFEQENDKKYI